MDLDKPQSLMSRLRALAIPQSFTHVRTTSALSANGRTTDGKEIEASGSAQSGALAATLEEDSGAEADADADAEESAAEYKPPSSTPRKRRRRARRVDDIETAPSSPNSPMPSGITNDPLNVRPDRPRVLTRRATDTEMGPGQIHQGLSEDEGRKHLSRDNSAWTPRHPLRGLSYGGQRKPGDSTPEASRRPLTLLNFATITSSREGAQSESQTPKTPSRRKLMAERARR